MKKQLVAIGAVLGASIVAASATPPAITEISTAITDATTVATTIGGAGLGLLGVFIVFKLIRRAARSLV